MPNDNTLSNRRLRSLRTFFFAGMVLVLLGSLSGCKAYRTIMHGKPPYDEHLYEIYSQSKLRVSTVSDVKAFGLAYQPENELISQSQSVIVSQGQKRKGTTVWLNMVSFEKYIFIVNDKYNLMDQPKKNLSFDCAMVLEDADLAGPHANENAFRIALLKRILQKIHTDINQVASDNKMLDICGMMVNQSFEAAQVKLNSSPAYASKLKNPAGMEFSHMSFDKGRIRLLFENDKEVNELVKGDIVSIKLRLGKAAKKMAKSR
ncbi:MAG: hypothetical protein ACYSWP_10775 [Planctomycetota bacterium]